MTRNTTGQKLTVFAFDRTTNAPKTGDAANITAYVSIDNGTLAALADTSATEISSTNAAGYYLFDLSQAETNGDKLTFTAKSSTSNIVVVAVPAVVFTRPANFSTLVLTASQAVGTSTYGGTDTTGVTSILAFLNGLTPIEEADLETPATVATAVRTELTTELARLDVAVGTRATQAQITGGTYSLATDGGGRVRLASDGLGQVTAWTVNLTGNLSGSVGSVTGNVGGNVVGSVASVTNGVTLAATQSLYAPAKAGDAMTLTSDYDAAKTAASATTAADIKAKTDNLPASPASTADVQPTINFNPTINPTTLDSAERTQIAASVAANAVIQQIAADAAAGAEGGLDANTIANAVWAYGDRRVTDGRIVQALRTQTRTREIVQGNTYGSSARAFPVMASDGGEWPADLSEYEWETKFAPLDAKGNVGAAVLTATTLIAQATGDSKGLSVFLTMAETASLTPGKYAYAVRGTSGTTVWDVEAGQVEVKSHP